MSEREKIALGEVCPVCNAAEGVWCLLVGGTGQYATDLHTMRIRQGEAYVRGETPAPAPTREPVAYVTELTTPEGTHLGPGFHWPPLKTEGQDFDAMRAAGWTVVIRPLVYADVPVAAPTETAGERERAREDLTTWLRAAGFYDREEGDWTDPSHPEAGAMSIEAAAAVAISRLILRSEVGK